MLFLNVEEETIFRENKHPCIKVSGTLGQCLSGMLEPLACLSAVLGLEIVQYVQNQAVQ